MFRSHSPSTAHNSIFLFLFTRLPLFLLLFVFSPLVVNATIFELKDGTTVEGDVLTEEGNDFYIETTDGSLRNLASAEIHKIDGKQHEAAIPVQSEKEIAAEKVPRSPQRPVKSSSTREPPRSGIPTLDPANLIARVGQGGILHAELENYLAVVSSEAQENPEHLQEGSRKTLLEHAIHLEMIFEAALTDNMHLEERMRERILGFYLKDKVEFTTQPKTLSEQEKRAFYESHRDRFQTDGTIMFAFHQIPPPWNESSSKRATYVGNVNADKSIVPMWIGTDWVSETENCAVQGPMIQAHCAEIFEMEKDAVKLFESHLGNILVWFKDKREGETKEFESLRNHEFMLELTHAKQLEAYQKLMQTLPEPSEGALFRAALHENYHRLPIIRQALIFGYVAKHKTSFANILNRLNSKADNEVLAQNLSELTPRLNPVTFVSPYWHKNFVHFDSKKGGFTELTLEPIHGEASFWKSAWAPSEKLIFETPGQKATPPVIQEEITAQIQNEVRPSPLGEELDSVRQIAEQHEKLNEKLGQDPPRASKKYFVLMLAFAGLVLITLFLWILSRF